MGYLINLGALMILMKIIDTDESPQLCAFIFGAVRLATGFTFGTLFGASPLVIIGVAAADALVAFIYFRILARLDGTKLKWPVLLLGAGVLSL